MAGKWAGKGEGGKEGRRERGKAGGVQWKFWARGQLLPADANEEGVYLASYRAQFGWLSAVCLRGVLPGMYCMYVRLVACDTCTIAVAITFFAPSQ